MKTFLLIWLIAAFSYLQGAFFTKLETRGWPVFIGGGLTGIAILIVVAVTR